MVQINAIPSGLLVSSRGLCQGDPLYLLLSVKVMEALGRLKAKALEWRYLSGFSVNNLNCELLGISHILFADDTIRSLGQNLITCSIRGVFCYVLKPFQVSQI